MEWSWKHENISSTFMFIVQIVIIGSYILQRKHSQPVSWLHHSNGILSNSCTSSCHDWCLIQKQFYQCESSFVPHTLMDLFLNLKLCYCWLPLTRKFSFRSYNYHSTELLFFHKRGYFSHLQTTKIGSKIVLLCFPSIEQLR